MQQPDTETCGLEIAWLCAKRIGKMAEAFLDGIKGLAGSAGVPCSGHYVTSQSPAQEIVEAAETYDCDCIVMGTRGNKGLKTFLLGSETQKVLTSANVPVIVTPH